MSMNTKTRRVGTTGVALGVPVVTGALLGAQLNHHGLPPSATGSVRKTVDPEDVQSDRTPRAPQSEDAKVNKQERDRALANVKQERSALREQMAQVQQAQGSPPACAQAANDPQGVRGAS